MAIIINAKGTSLDTFAVGKNKLVFNASNLTTTRTLTFPDSNGSENQVLTTNGSGILSWTSVGGVPGPTTLTGDVTGSGTGTFQTTLATVNSSVGSYGSATQAATFTVNSKGLVTAASQTTITPAFSSITSKPTTLSGYGITDGFSSSGGTITGNVNMTGHIIPSADVTYDLGSPSLMWRDLYVGPGSIWMNGKKILEDVSDTITFTTDINQNLRVQTSGSGNLELMTATSGAVVVKASLQITSGKKILDTAGTKVEFGDDIDMSTNKVINLGAPVNPGDATTKSYVDSITTNDTTIVRTTGTQSIGGDKTFTGSTVLSGNLTVNGAISSINSESVSFADNIIEVNSNFTSGTPTENAGFQVRRGDLGVVRFIWDETNDYFTMTDGQNTPGYKSLYTAATITAGTFVGPLTGNASTASALSTARSITATGDASWTVNFDGSSNQSATLTLATVGTAGTYKSVTVNAKGLVTSGTNPTTLAGFGIVDAQPLDADLTAIAAITGTQGLLKKTATDTWTLDTSNYITGNETITLSGDITGSGTTAITATLATVNANVGAFGSATTVPVVTVNGKGLVTSVSTSSIAVAASQTTSGTFADARISQSSVTQHQAALTIAETQITNGNILARVADSETISGSWIFNNPVTVGSPVVSTDAATKQYVDDSITGLDFKASVRVATTANLSTFSGTQTVDGVTLVAGNRILIKNQTDATANGIYVSSGGTLVRAPDADDSPDGEVSSGMYTFVEEGATNANSGWVLTTSNPITLGTTPLSFTQFTGTGQITAGAGLTMTGSTIDVVTASSSRIVVNADSIDLATAGTAGTYKSVTTDAYGRVTSGTNPTTLSGYGITDAQALDTDLTAIAGLSTTGVIVRTGSGTATTRSIAASGVGLSITNANGIAGDPTVVSNATSAATASTLMSRDGGGSTSANNLSLGGNLILNSGSTAVNGIELGSIGGASNPYIDFHSGATATDYDARIQAFGGTGSSQGGSVSYLANAGHNFTGAVAVTTSGATSTAAFIDTGASGANIRLSGNGATTPSKYLRAFDGKLEFVNNGYSAVIASLTDAGIFTANGFSGPLTGNVTGSASLNVLKAGDTMSGALGISYGGGTASATPHLTLTNGGSYSISVIPKSPAGAYNNLVAANDHSIIYQGTGIDSGEGLVIGPWTSTEKGIRIDGSGGLTVAGSTNVKGANLWVNGTSNLIIQHDGTNGYIRPLNGGSLFLGSGTTNTVNVTSVAVGITGNLTVTGVINGSTVNTSGSGVGYTSLQRGTATHSGYIEFISAAGNRQGYIGFSNTNAAQDAGTVNYNAGTHLFTGVVSFNSETSTTVGALGSTAGNQQVVTTNTGTTTNTDSLITRLYRVANGSTWETATHEIRRKVDASDGAYVRFGGTSDISRFAIGNGAGTDSIVATSGAITLNSPQVNITGNTSGSSLSINGTGNSGRGAEIGMTGTGSNPSKYVRVLNGNFELINNAYTAGIFTVTDAGVASATAAFNAPLYNGYSISEAATGSTLAARTSAGYLYTSYLNQSSPNSENPSISQVMVTSASDGFLRKASIAHLTSSLSGTAPISITGSAASTSNFTVSSTYTGDLNALITAGMYRLQNANTNVPSGSAWQFGQLLVIRGGGDTITQLIGSYSTGEIFTRSGNPASIGGGGNWTTWRTVLDSVNYNSYAPQLNGTGANGTWGINITGQSATTKAVGTTDPNVGTGGLWTVSGTGLQIARNGTFYTGLDSANYNNYSPQLNGTGATGTWNITSVVAQNTVQSGSPSNANTYFSNTTAGQRQWSEVNGGTNYPNSGWFFVENMRHSNGANQWGRQTAYGWEDNALETYVRNITAGTWSGWTRMMTSSNIGGFAPSLTGTGASGTWGINVTGNSATTTLATKSNTIALGGAGGAAATFSYSGQSGQPAWLWGTNDGTNNLVWNPSNFNVNYAASAGNSTTTSQYSFGTLIATANSGASTSTAGSVGGLQLTGSGGGGAIGSFHRPGAYAVNFGLDSDNVFRIGGWSASANRMQMDMSGNLTMAGDVTAFSDIRKKKNITTIEGALDKVCQMRGVMFTRIEDDVKSTGVIAQEIQEVLPEVVKEDAEGTLSVAYGNIVGVLIEAVKDLKAEIELLKKQLSEKA